MGTLYQCTTSGRSGNTHGYASATSLKTKLLGAGGPSVINFKEANQQHALALLTRSQRARITYFPCGLILTIETHNKSNPHVLCTWLPVAHVICGSSVSVATQLRFNGSV